MSIRIILLALTMLIIGSHPSVAADDYKTKPEYLALRDSMRAAFNNADSARFFPALYQLEEYVLKKNDMHEYYTQRCNEIVFQMNRQRIFEAYKLARKLSQELREKKLDKEMYMAYNMMGHLNRYCGNKEAAKDCFYQVIKMMEQAGYYESMPPIYMNIVNVELGDNPQEAQELLDKAAEIARRYAPDRVFDIETRKTTLSYFNGGDKKKFIEGYKKYREGVEEGKSSVHGRIMEIYYQVCIGNTDEALQLANDEPGEDGREAITMINEQAGRWKEAFESLQKQTRAQDSINNVVLSNSMEGINDELRIYDAEHQTTRIRTIALSGTVVLLALLVAALTYITISRRKHLKELKQAYDHVLEADKMKADFIRNITHEVRTPLNIISGFGQILSDPDLDAGPNERKEMANMMQKNTNQITTLIDEMLEISLSDKAASAVPKDDIVKVNGLLKRLMEENGLKLAHGVTFKLDSQLADDFTIQSNKEILKRIINPLIDNACKYTSKGTITLKAATGDGQLKLVVEDTGIGIPEKDAKRVFERFVKLDTFKEGLGLGLPLSRMLANRIGGDISLDKSYKDGARIILTLDL